MITLLALMMIGVRASEIRAYPLDERTVYTIRLNKSEPTTCVFPAPIKAIVGANVSTKAEDNPGILLSHEVGTDYFSLRLMKDGATGALNIVLRGKVYALIFVAAPEPDRAVVFLDDPAAMGNSGGLSVESLRGLIERAKQLERADAATPGRVLRLESARPDLVVPFRAFTATIESVVRFEAEDALVFRVRLENPLAVAVAYDPAGLAIRLDREFFPAACTEASGAIPANGTSYAYLVIAGGPAGRANLSVREKFSVVIPRP
jgi:hypothetical protein